MPATPAIDAAQLVLTQLQDAHELGGRVERVGQRLAAAEGEGRDHPTADFRDERGARRHSAGVEVREALELPSVFA